MRFISGMEDLFKPTNVIHHISRPKRKMTRFYQLVQKCIWQKFNIHQDKKQLQASTEGAVLSMIKATSKNLDIPNATL